MHDIKQTKPSLPQRILYRIRWLMNRSFPLSLLCSYPCWYLPSSVHDIIRKICYIHYTPIFCTKHMPLLEELLFHVAAIFTLTFRHTLPYWILWLYMNGKWFLYAVAKIKMSLYLFAKNDLVVSTLMFSSIKYI